MREHIEEKELVRRAKAGDENAFARLTKPHAQKAFYAALRIVHHRQDAEDAVQSAMLNAFVHIDKFRGTSTFSTWLHRITINQSLMLLRKRRSLDAHVVQHVESEDSRPISETIAAPAAERPDTIHARRREQDTVRAAIHQLRESLCATVWLYAVEDCDLREIASALGVSYGAVKARLFHARAELRVLLAKGYN